MIEINFPNAVNEPEDLFGRTHEFERLLYLIEHRRRPLIVVRGERLIGKTSLQKTMITELRRRKRDDILVLMPPPAISFAGFAGELLDTLRCTLSPNPLSGELTARHLDERKASQSEYLSAYRHLMAQAPGTTFLICIDEFDSLLHNCPAEERSEIVSFAIHLLLNGNLPVLACFTMTDPTARFGDDYPTHFLDRATSIQLRTLTPENTAHMVTALLQPVAAVSAEAQRDLYALSGGHPYFVKLLLFYLLEVLQHDVPVPLLSAGDVRRALLAAIHSAEAQFSLDNILHAHFTDNERAALSLLTSHQGQIAWTEVGDLGLPLRALIDRGFLGRTDEGQVRFKIGYLYYWLQQHRPTSASVVVGNESFPSRIVAANEPTAAPVREVTASIPTLIVDARRRRTHLGGVELSLSPKLYEVLVCLARQGGEVVSKDQIAAEAWPDTNEGDGVSDAAIDRVVARLRDKLRDALHREEDVNEYIKTRPGFGYTLYHAHYIP